MKDIRTSALVCLRLLLRPIVGFCLRRALTIQDFYELSKSVFVEVGAAQIRKDKGRPNVSRLSVLTGLRRKEVSRLLTSLNEEEIPVEFQSASLLTKVIGVWSSDPRFTTKSGKPRVLTFDGNDSEFSQLVKAISSDVKPRAVYSELCRIGAIEQTLRGIRLSLIAYVPQGDPAEGFELLALDAEDLLLAVEENIFTPKAVPNLHVTTEFDNISRSKLPELRQWCLEEGVGFHNRVKKHLALLDRDINPRLRGEGKVRVVLGSFSRISEEEDA
ncbi:MAG: hypothetical protein KDD55_02395 [Bdellovibrionales bacterium]|nr:hypothetical protein [Bdellovibrionales bacterium]